jgi:hypothetical protein
VAGEERRREFPREGTARNLYFPTRVQGEMRVEVPVVNRLLLICANYLRLVSLLVLGNDSKRLRRGSQREYRMALGKWPGKMNSN